MMDRDQETFYGVPLSTLSPCSPFTLHLGYDVTYQMGICLLLVTQQGCKWRVSGDTFYKGIPYEYNLWHRNMTWSRHAFKEGYHLQLGQVEATLEQLKYLIGYAKHHEEDEQKQYVWRTRKIGKYAF